MANLTRTWRWETFEPDFGDNLSLPEGQRLQLEIASGISPAQYRAFGESIQEAAKARDGDSEEVIAKRWADVFSPVVRMVSPPPGQLHTVEGKTISTLADYIAVLLTMTGIYNLHELTDALRNFNSVEGTSRLFYRRQSGGTSTTRGQTVVKGVETTAGR